MIWEPWGVIPPVEVPGYPKELMAAPVMTAASGVGTQESSLLSIDRQAGANGQQDLNFLLLHPH